MLRCGALKVKLGVKLRARICAQARQLLQARDEIRLAKAPEPGRDWQRLTPSDDLNFTSNSWSIALDCRTGVYRCLRLLPFPVDIICCAR